MAHFSSIRHQCTRIAPWIATDKIEPRELESLRLRRSLGFGGWSLTRVFAVRSIGTECDSFLYTVRSSEL
jgi:hypothetical protein